MNDEIRLIYPTIDLFLYDLRVGLDQDEKEIDCNRSQFWQKIYGDRLDNQRLEEFKQAEKDSSDYIHLLGSKKKVEKFEPRLDGYYYPVQLGDTYGLQVDCTANYISDHKYSPQPITCLPKLQAEVLAQINEGDCQPKLGHSWLLWGQMATENQDFEETARKCYEQLKFANKGEWTADLQGEFLGGTLFELWQLPLQGQLNGDGYHILICLFPHHLKIDAIRESVAKLYPQLMRLFAYRNKILWAYTQSRSLKENLKQASQLVQAIVSDLNTLSRSPENRIDGLQKVLAETPEILLKYTNNLSYLDDQRRTIKINIGNYNKRWQKLQEIDRNSDWKFFQEFGKFAEEKCLEQIVADQENLSPKLTLMENTIKTIQGMIDIEQTKSDRTLNSTIAVAGIGLATSQIAVAVILIPDPPDHKVSFAYRTEVFVGSLVIGAIAAILSLIILRSLQDRKQI